MPPAAATRSRRPGRPAPAPAPASVGGRAGAVVAHLDLERPVREREPHPHAGSGRVLERVGEPFLHDPVGRRLELGVEPDAVGQRRQLHVQARGARPLGQRRERTVAVIRIGVEDVEQPVHLAHRLRGRRADHGEALRRPRRRLGCRHPARAGLDDDHRQVVGHDVVQLARDAGALVAHRQLDVGLLL